MKTSFSYCPCHPFCCCECTNQGLQCVKLKQNNCFAFTMKFMWEKGDVCALGDAQWPLRILAQSCWILMYTQLFDAYETHWHYIKIMFLVDVGSLGLQVCWFKMSLHSFDSLQFYGFLSAELEQATVPYITFLEFTFSAYALISSETTWIINNFLSPFSLSRSFFFFFFSGVLLSPFS